MISKSKLRYYFLKRCDNITGSLNRFCETGDHEEIHKLRVEFKKLRALVSLVNECTDNSLIPSEFRTAKMVYKRAGTVRDAYIARQQHIAVSQVDSGGVTEFLELAARQFCSKRELHLLVMNDWRDLVKEQFENIGNHLAVEFYRKWLHRLEHKFMETKEDELHDCRKIIKKLMYLYPLMPAPVKNELNINTDYLDALQEEIGKWHDTLVAREHYSVAEGEFSKHLQHLEKESASRMNSIKTLTDNFHDKIISV